MYMGWYDFWRIRIWKLVNARHQLKKGASRLLSKVLRYYGTTISAHKPLERFYWTLAMALLCEMVAMPHGAPNYPRHR